jgi:hypothetical protein
MKTLKVSQLKKGDVLASTGAEVLSCTHYGEYCGQKNRAMVITRKGIKETSSLWGYNSTVKIKDNE